MYLYIHGYYIVIRDNLGIGRSRICGERWIQFTLLRLTLYDASLCQQPEASTHISESWMAQKAKDVRLKDAEQNGGTFNDVISLESPRSQLVTRMMICFIGRDL
jgi:hypothetical protein